MYDNGSETVAAAAVGVPAGARDGQRRFVAWERAAGYDAAPNRTPATGTGAGAGGPVALSVAVEGLAGAVDAVQRVDVAAAADGELLDAAVALQRLADRVTAAQLAVLGRVDARDAYRADGAVTAAAWLRGRVRVDHAHAVRLVEAARRLPQLPALQQALAAGETTVAHVTAVTRAAVPQRIDAIAQVDDVLAALARRGSPRDVRRAVQRVREVVDADGSDALPLDERGVDERRSLDVAATIDGLVAVRGLLDRLHGEALLTVLDAFERPDAPDTPPARRRSAAQRRADALHDALQTLLERGDAPQVHKVKPHVTAAVDLLDVLTDDQAQQLRDGQVSVDDLAADLAQRFGLTPDHHHTTTSGEAAGDDSGAAGGGNRERTDAAGDDGGVRPDGGAAGGPLWDLDADAAERALTLADPQPTARPRRQRRGSAARLRFTGELDAERARRLLLQARVQVVLTLGPWRVVNVGRVHRTLPAWLRGALELVHRHCRGPDCDRPITWTQAHHTHAWGDGGDTDVNHTVPLCHAHHQMITSGGWTVTLDPDTGICTWTGPDHQTIHTRPHP